MKRYIHSACNKNNKPIKAATEQERIDLIRSVTDRILRETYADDKLIDIQDLIKCVKNYFLYAHNPILDLGAMEDYDDLGAAFEDAINLIIDVVNEIAKESNGRIIDVDAEGRWDEINYTPLED